MVRRIRARRRRCPNCQHLAELAQRSPGLFEALLGAVVKRLRELEARAEAGRAPR